MKHAGKYNGLKKLICHMKFHKTIYRDCNTGTSYNYYTLLRLAANFFVVAKKKKTELGYCLNTYSGTSI